MFNPNPNQFEVFSGCRLILKLTCLFNKNDLYIGCLKIPSILIYCCILLPTFYSAMMEIWFCFDEKFDFDTTSITIAMAIGYVQMMLVYISLVIKTDLIVESIDHLKDVVEKSKHFLFFNFCQIVMCF